MEGKRHYFLCLLSKITDPMSLCDGNGCRLSDNFCWHHEISCYRVLHHHFQSNHNQFYRILHHLHEKFWDKIPCHRYHHSNENQYHHHQVSHHPQETFWDQILHHHYHHQHHKFHYHFHKTFLTKLLIIAIIINIMNFIIILTKVYETKFIIIIIIIILIPFS